jgi:hypothetical protein
MPPALSGSEDMVAYNHRFDAGGVGVAEPLYCLGFEVPRHLSFGQLDFNFVGS